MVNDDLPLLQVRGLVKHYPLSRGVVFRKRYGEVRAVDGVDLTLHRGQTLGLEGESGCGKSTLARVLMRLEEPTAGHIAFGEDLLAASPRRLRRIRRLMQLVFQDPYSSLGPRKTVGDLVGEPFRIHRDVRPSGAVQDRVRELLAVVGLDPDHINRYPHQFSGGQRQRISIARALALQPDLIVCDEPVSALDVSVQAQVINLLEQLRDSLAWRTCSLHMTCPLSGKICDRVAVMYLGRVVETGSEAEVYDHATHPYTQALLSAAPDPDPAEQRRQERIVLSGDVPSPANPPSGCRFRTRCWKAQEVCAQKEARPRRTRTTAPGRLSVLRRAHADRPGYGLNGRGHPPCPRSENRRWARPTSGHVNFAEPVVRGVIEQPTCSVGTAREVDVWSVKPGGNPMMPFFSDEFPFHQRADNAPTAADEDLAARVAARLGRESLTPEDHVVVSVQNGVVILEGMLGRQSLAERLHRATWQVVGVIDVSNQLSAWDSEPDAP